jgi:hypothetical protein
MSFELQLSVEAPHELVFLDGCMTTPIVFFNRSLSKASGVPHLHNSSAL